MLTMRVIRITLLLLMAAVMFTSACGPAKTELTEGQSKALFTVSTKGTEYITFIKLNIFSNSVMPLKVRILKGTVFESKNNAIQNMITTKTMEVILEPSANVSMDVPSACMNMGKNIPGKNDTLALRIAPASGDLGLLLIAQDWDNKKFRVQQFAIWAITDNSTKDKYSYIGLSGTYSVPSYAEMSEIRTLFKATGISTGKYAALK